MAKDPVRIPLPPKQRRAKAAPKRRRMELEIPNVSIALQEDGVLVKMDPMPESTKVLAACLQHAAAQMAVLSAVGEASGVVLNLEEEAN